MRPFFVIILSSLVGLGAGFGLRALLQNGGGLSSAEGSRSQSGTTAPDSPLPGGAGARAAESTLAVRLKADLTTSASLSDDVTRWLLWMTAVEKAGPGDFPHLARMAKSMPGALNILAAHWIENDPRGLFEACVRGDQGEPGFPTNELAQLLFETWPKKDPDAVFAALARQPSLQRGWQMTSLNSLFQIDPERALIAMSDLRIDSYGPNMKGVEKWAAADPAHAAEVALAHPAGFATQLVLETIGKEWARSDPQAALAFSATRNNAHGRELAGHVIRGWVERDLAKASDWFASADGTTRERMLPAFVEAWGKKDAPNALRWCLTNTEGGQQSDVIASLVKGALAENPDTAAVMVAGLEVSPLRTKAAVTFADAMVQRGWWPNTISGSGNDRAKPEAIEWLGKLDPEARKKVISSIQWSWSENDPRGFAEYLSTPAGQAADPDAMASAARSLVRQKPLEAIEWASQIKGDTQEAALSDTFGGWIHHQPEAAMQWLEKLPSGDPRRESFYLAAVRDALPAGTLAETSAVTAAEGPNPAREFARQLATDPAAARGTLDRLSLSEAAKAKAMRRLGL